MKDAYIKFRIAKDEKVLTIQDAYLDGYDDTSAYILNLLRQNRKKLRKTT